jgi:hypothetical protein
LQAALERLEAGGRDVERAVDEEDQQERPEQEDVEGGQFAEARCPDDAQEGGVAESDRAPETLDGAALPPVEERPHPHRPGELERDAREEHHEGKGQPADTHRFDDRIDTHAGLSTIRTAVATITAETNGPRTLTGRRLARYSGDRCIGSLGPVASTSRRASSSARR